MTTNNLIVAVDGHAGSGKSSICESAAKILDWHYFSTGILYRYTAALFMSQGLDDPKTAAQQVRDHGKWNYSTGSIEFDKFDLRKEIYNENISSVASKVAGDPDVREILLELQRSIARNSTKGMIVDGRDIGTVVFPEAPLKLFMTASAECRALRRVHQIIGTQLTDEEAKKHPRYQEIYQSIEDRDHRDSKRQIAPLLQAQDAQVFETSNMTKQEAIKQFVQTLKSTFKL